VETLNVTAESKVIELIRVVSAKMERHGRVSVFSRLPYRAVSDITEQDSANIGSNAPTLNRNRKNQNGVVSYIINDPICKRGDSHVLPTTQ
jgi:hypothetical protein